MSLTGLLSSKRSAESAWLIPFRWFSFVFQQVCRQREFRFFGVSHQLGLVSGGYLDRDSLGLAVLWTFESELLPRLDGD